MTTVMKYTIVLILLVMATSVVTASDKEDLLAGMDRRAAMFDKLALDIWDYAELGYLEEKSAQRLIVNSFHLRVLQGTRNQRD